MTVDFIYFVVHIGIYLLASSCEASVTSSNKTRTCSNFPNGLQEEDNIIIDSSSRWPNQCPSGQIIVGLWSPGSQLLMKDMKCCKEDVDQILTVASFDVHHLDNGPSQIDQKWNLQCRDNHVITGLKIAGHSQDRSSHLAAMQCSLLLRKQVIYSECQRIDISSSSSSSLVTDPSVVWPAECPSNSGLVALYSTNGFKTVLYGKCCKIQDTTSLQNQPWICPVSPENMCGWTLSKDTSLSWKYLSTSGGMVHFLYLSPTASSGSATIASPGYFRPPSMLCFRLTYMIRLYAAIKISMKSYNVDEKVSYVQDIQIISRSTGALAKKDFIIKPKSNFQLIVEGQRIKSIASTVWISELAFVPLDQCNADRCVSPYQGCGVNEICLPNGPLGYKDCVCKQGYIRVNGKCASQVHTDKLDTRTMSIITSPIVTTGGSHRGGDGKTDGGGEKKPDQGGSDRDATNGKSKITRKSQTSIEPWVYTAFGGVCGTLLVLLLVFSFLAYRKRTLNRQLYRFDLDANYLRPRTMSGSFLSDNNNSYVPEPTIQPFSTDITSSAVDIELHSVPSIQFPDDHLSENSGSPPSHHYFEVEQEIAYLDRKISQTTLVSPMYGSSEDIEDSSYCEKFLEPPSDEKELCAQLDKEIDRKELSIAEKKLGQGAFGFVHYGVWNKADGDCKTVAIKSMKNAKSAEERIKFFQEAAIMKQFAHQNVVYMFGVVTKRYPPMIVLEYMKNGNLRKYLNREKRSRLKQGLERIDYDMHQMFLRMAREIVAGMTYLAGMQFVHRDLAARNILLGDDFVCKIGDFGLARDLIGCEHYISQGGQIPVKWTAPEALAFRRYSTASDVWSFGILLYEMWSVGRKPYESWSNDEVIESVCNHGFRLPPPKDCPPVIYHLMIDCWHPEETKRPRFSQIKYCLAQKDERLLGRREPRRQRSATLNELPCETIREDYGELQYVYCKTN
eukprot:gene17432-19176_t